MKIVMVAMVMAACVDEPTVVTELGVLQLNAEPIKISVAGPQVAGTPFLVNITTYGGGCGAFEIDRTDVEQGPDVADILVFDHVPHQTGDGEHPCTANLLLLLHATTLTFDQPGPKTLRVHGRRVIVDDQDVIVELPIVVQSAQ